MKKIFFFALLIVAFSCAFSTPTIYGPNGMVTYPSATMEGSLISIQPYVMSYGGESRYGAVTANVDLKYVEAYGLVAVTTGKNFSIDHLNTYGAKVKYPIDEKMTVAAGATLSSNDCVDYYLAASREIVDTKIVDLDLTGGVNFHTTTNDFEDNDTRLYLGATGKLTSFLSAGAEASVPLNGDGGTIYSAKVSANIVLLNLNLGLTNNKYGKRSETLGYFLNVGYSFSGLLGR